MAVLGTDGVGALTIARLCTELGVTKGSFYHHFRGVEDYRTQLLEYWSHEREQEVVDASRRFTDALDRLDALRDVGVGLHHDAEVAIRAWSRSDPEAWAVRERVDERREEIIADAYIEVGVDEDVARLLGRLGVAVLIGAQHRGFAADADDLRELYTHLQEMAKATYVPPRVGLDD